MVGDPLRLAQPGNAVHDVALFEVNDSHAVIAKLGDEQELPIRVEGKVIDAAAHRAERDLRLENQRRRVRRPARRRQHHAEQGRQHRHALHCLLLAIGLVSMDG